MYKSSSISANIKIYTSAYMGIIQTTLHFTFTVTPIESTPAAPPIVFYEGMTEYVGT